MRSLKRMIPSGDVCGVNGEAQDHISQVDVEVFMDQQMRLSSLVHKSNANLPPTVTPPMGIVNRLGFFLFFPISF